MNKAPHKIQKMFDNIAKNYDKLNDIISFGMQKRIKQKCIKLLNINTKTKLLDLCTGTGDLISMANVKDSIGVDFSEKMLEIARVKHPNYNFINTNCSVLPFDDNSFDIITMGFGLRNIENREQVLKEIYRVLKPNGEFLQLDFGNKNFIGKIFEILIPNLVKFTSADKNAYEYLVQSKREFPEPKELIKEIEQSGFKLKICKFFTFKAISCQIFTK